MAATSSTSPSSSAVTLPRPGKSILKRPPPAQHSFFSLSRLSRLLPSQAAPPTPANANSSNEPSDASLKRAHFFLPHLVTVYPISSASPPCGPNVKEEKRTIDSREEDRLRRILRGNSYGPGNSETEDWWSIDKVESFYRECCEGREEKPHAGISAALKKSAGIGGRSLDLSGVQLTLAQAATLSDVFSVEWGLRKLVLKECNLDEHTLKPLLHALTIPGTLTFLSIASNRRLKTPAFRLVGAFMRKSNNLQFLDVSQNYLDKKSVEYIGSGLRSANEQGLVSLRMDDCNLRPASLDVLAQAVRSSSLRNISLRHNRISASGAVALALMIKDYPDTMPLYGSQSAPRSPSSPDSSSLFSSFSLSTPPGTPSTMTPPMTPTLGSSPLPSPMSSLQALPLQSTPSQSPNGTPTHASFAREGPVLPPPRLPPPPVHPATLPPQTTYTPYVPRSRRGVAAAHSPAAAPNAAKAPATIAAVTQQAAALTNVPTSLSRQVPMFTSSAQGGITMRHPISPSSASPAVNALGLATQQAGVDSVGGGNGISKHGPSAALLDKVRALDSLPRLGELRTLDLRGNDVRNGITYIAQVLKRNRTLKVLNLSENKIDVQGLVTIAEALKYNLTLETLDLNRNPCSGPSLEGIQSLRTAFTLNTSLKRLFLSSTSLTSAGAIALAEFLPESTSLLHLDLTSNNLDLAAVMALSGGLKANHTMRCLDLNIPPDDEEFARMCRSILNTCIRNTEEADKIAQARGGGKGVWGMIEDSELAKTFRQGDDLKTDEDVIAQTKLCRTQLHEQLTQTPPAPVDPDLVKRAEATLPVLAAIIQSTADPARLEELLLLNDSLISLLSQTTNFTNGSTLPGTPSELSSTSTSREGSVAGSHSNGTSTPTTPVAKANGGALSLHITPNMVASEELTSEDEPPSPETPRVDKGKARAEPEEEKILSPSFLISTPDDSEDEEGKLALVMEPESVAPSPTKLSKSWVAEEGEIFRKGNALLTEEELEGEYDGEELRIELLEAEVERPPPRALNLDDFGMELSSTTPFANPFVPDADVTDVSSPTQQEPKPPPRPYLRRSRSSSSGALKDGIVSPVSAGSTETVGTPQGTESKVTTAEMELDVTSPTTPVPYSPRLRSPSDTANPDLP